MSGKQGKASLVLMIIFILLAIITLPGFLNYWYRAAVGNSIYNQVTMFAQVNPNFDIDIMNDLNHPLREQIGNRAKQEGLRCAMFMLAGLHNPFFLLILFTIGILSRSTNPKFRTLLKLAFPLVCLSAGLFLSFGTTYWGTATPFPESLGPAFLIWLAIAGFFCILIGLPKLISFLSRPEENSKDEL